MSKTPISKEGWQALQDELNELLEVERPRVVREVEAAAAQGDRSENAEYIFGKKRLREIDKRWRFLSQRIQKVAVVDGPPPDASVVRFGASIELANAAGRTMNVTIVGEDEIDPAAGRISLRSPLGVALLGHSLHDEITVTTPRGPVTWKIQAIRYS
jgi:transcription elongation factor GreB